MTSTVGAVALAIVSVLGLVMWILNRRNNATPEQKANDRNAELDRLRTQVFAARAAGDDALAESLLRRLCELQNSGSNPASGSTGTAGQLGDRDAASGNGSDSAGKL
jgi:hypothetical protein